MKKRLIPVLLTAIVFGSSSCSEKISSVDIPTDEILRSYSANYQTTGGIYVIAEFYSEAGFSIPPFKRAHGKNVTLHPPSKVLFNGQEMEMKEDLFGSVSYKIKLNSWPGSFKWVWTDREGKQYTDEAKMQPISLSDNPLNHVGDKLILNWEGGPIREGEEIWTSLSFEDSGSSFTEYNANIGEQSIKMNDGGYRNLDYSDFNEVIITRTLVIENFKINSVGSQTGSFIKLRYWYEEID